MLLDTGEKANPAPAPGVTPLPPRRLVECASPSPASAQTRIQSSPRGELPRPCSSAEISVDTGRGVGRPFADVGAGVALGTARAEGSGGLRACREWAREWRGEHTGSFRATRAPHGEGGRHGGHAAASSFLHAPRRFSLELVERASLSTHVPFHSIRAGSGVEPPAAARGGDERNTPAARRSSERVRASSSSRPRLGHTEATALRAAAQ